MLRALYQLAETEKLVGDSAYEMKPIAWTIDLGKDGEFLGFTPNHYTPLVKEGQKSKKKPKEIAKRFLVPRQFVVETGATRTSGAYAYFLVDKGDYVLGFQPGAVPNEPQTEKKLRQRHDLFIQKVADCANSTKNDQVRAVLTFLRQVSSGGLPAAIPEKAVTNDLMAFRVAPETERHVHDLSDVADYWRAVCDSDEGTSEDSSELRCLISGEPITTQGLFPSIKGVPGGATSGAGLVSFNAKAFESYGWKGEANAPIGKAAAQKCAVALNRLLDPDFELPDGTKLEKRNLRCGKDTVLVYWSKSQSPLADHLHRILNPQEDPGPIEDMFGSIWKGKAFSKNFDPNPFYAATLTGSQGRIIVRDWIETTAAVLWQNIRNHLEGLEIAPLTRPAKGKSLPPFLGLNTLLQSAVLGGKPDNVPPPLAAEFLHAILCNTPYPISLLHRALQRQRMEKHDDSWTNKWRGDSRVAICKAILKRNFEIETQSTMNPNEHRPPYILGRLLACYGEMQRLAHLPREVNATLVDKFYGQFSTNPFSLLRNLDRLYQNNRKTAFRNQSKPWIPGRSRNIDTTVGKLLAVLGTTLPGEFGVESQALFVLGFHHQNHWFQMNEEQRTEWLKAEGHQSETIKTIL